MATCELPKHPPLIFWLARGQSESKAPLGDNSSLTPSSHSWHSIRGLRKGKVSVDRVTSLTAGQNTHSESKRLLASPHGRDPPCSSPNLVMGTEGSIPRSNYAGESTISHLHLVRRVSMRLPGVPPNRPVGHYFCMQGSYWYTHDLYSTACTHAPRQWCISYLIFQKGPSAEAPDAPQP
jgi:hypothetical protein